MPPVLPNCMHLDGQSSREGYECLQMCKENKCEIVQSPSNTTHFLQPCDQDVNRSFKKSMRTYRGLSHKQKTLDMRTLRANLMVAALAYSTITIESIKLSFKKTGLWPMNYSFLDRFISDRQGPLGNGATAGKEAGKNVANRTWNSESHTFGRLQKVSRVCKRSRNRHSRCGNNPEQDKECQQVLMPSPGPAKTECRQPGRVKKFGIQKGTSALYLTLDYMVESRT